MNYSELRIYRNKCRRIRQRRIRIFRAFITLSLVLTLALSANVFLSNAKSDREAVLYKYYTSITVRPGETLWSIAQEKAGAGNGRARDYIDEVMRMNYLEDENITAGQSIIVPYYSSEFNR